MGLLHHLQQPLLQRILGVCIIAGDAPDQAPQRWPQAPHQGGERLLVAVTAPGEDEPGILVTFRGVCAGHGCGKRGHRELQCIGDKPPAADLMQVFSGLPAEPSPWHLGDDPGRCLGGACGRGRHGRGDRASHERWPTLSLRALTWASAACDQRRGCSALPACAAVGGRGAAVLVVEEPGEVVDRGKTAQAGDLMDGQRAGGQQLLGAA